MNDRNFHYSNHFIIPIIVVLVAFLSLTFDIKAVCGIKLI